MTKRHLDGAPAMGPVRQAAAGASGEAGGAALSSSVILRTARDGNHSVKAEVVHVGLMGSILHWA